MGNELLIEINYRRRSPRIRESVVGSLMRVIPAWTLIKLAVWVGSFMGGSYAKYFRWVGMGIGVLFSLGTIYQTAENYFSILRTVRGLFSFVSVAKRLLTRSPREINTEVEVEKVEKTFEEMEKEEEATKGEKRDVEDFSLIFLSESERVGLVSQTIKNIAKQFIDVCKNLLGTPLRKIGGFLVEGFNLVVGNSQKTVQLLEVFGFVKRAISFVFRNFILFFVLALIMVIVALLIIHSRKSKAAEKILGEINNQAQGKPEEKPPTDNEMKSIIQSFTPSNFKDEKIQIPAALKIGNFMHGVLGNLKIILSGNNNALSKVENGYNSIGNFVKHTYQSVNTFPRELI